MATAIFAAGTSTVSSLGLIQVGDQTGGFPAAGIAAINDGNTMVMKPAGLSLSAMAPTAFLQRPPRCDCEPGTPSTTRERSLPATFQTLPGTAFMVTGAGQARDAALVSASADVRWMNGVSLAGVFEGEFSDRTAGYAGKGIVRYEW